MRIIHIASPKNRISQYSISDPFIKALIFANENIIPWDQIPLPKQSNTPSEIPINQWLTTNLLPRLYSRIDPNAKGNYYIKNVDLEEEFKRNMHNPEVQQAYKIYRNDPEGAKKTIIDQVNEGKKETFFEWWNYVTEQYKDSPAFIYMMLKPIIDTSDITKQTPPAPINANAVASIYEKIKAGTYNLNIVKEFGAEVNKTSNIVSGTFEDGWIMIPSKSRSEANPTKYGNFEQNLDKLRTLGQAGGWCVGQKTFSTRYLSGGDFYIYVIGGKPKVAIRLEGETNVAEIRGKSNNSDQLYPYWEEVTSFLSKTNFDYKNNSEYKEIEEIALLNQDVEKNIPSIREKILAEPKTYGKLSSKNREIPELRSSAIEAWINKLKTTEDPKYYYNSIPENIAQEVKSVVNPIILKNILKERNKNINKERDRILYSDVPDELVPILPKDMIINVKNHYIERLKDSPDTVRHIPDTIFNLPDVKQNAINIWLKLLEAEPWRVSSCPDKILNSLPKDRVATYNSHIVSKVIHSLNANQDENPEEIVDGFQDAYEETLPETVEDRDLREIPQVLDAVYGSWCNYISQDPTRENKLYDVEYRVKGDYYKKNNSDMPYYQDEVNEAITNSWDNVIYNDPTRLHDAPEHVTYNYLEDKEGHQSLGHIWNNYLPANPDKLNRVDEQAIPFLSPHVLSTILPQYIQKHGLPNNIKDFLLDPKDNHEMVRVIFEHLDPETKNDIVDNNPDLVYDLERANDKLLKEKGQGEFPFANSLPPAKLSTAKSYNWYRKGKVLESLLPPEEDKSDPYLQAVKRNDLKIAQKMVDTKAKEMGYITRKGIVHATAAEIFYVFDKDKVGRSKGLDTKEGAAFFFTTDKLTGASVADPEAEGNVRFENVYLKINDPIQWDTSKWNDQDVIDTKLVASLIKRAKEWGKDGVIHKSKAMGETYIVFEPEQIKSSNPVTYDDSGEIIPLEQRFDSSNPDIRY